VRRVVAVLTAVVLLVVPGCDSSTGGSGNPDAAGPATGAAAVTATPSPSGSVVSLPDGVKHRVITGAAHVETKVSYPDSPPMGGNHSPVWADCTGTVYSAPIGTENAVHSMEHGAVWVTYRPDLDTAGVRALTTLVEGENYTLMSPYPGLDHAVSVQAWGYQLRTDDPEDQAIVRFVQAYRSNPKTAPEPAGSCVNPGYGH
jgi:hypothetical protein